MSSDGIVEVRPVRPEGKLTPHESATLRDWRLTADPASGTLTLTGDKSAFGSGQPRVFPLPSTGRPDAVTTICLATHHWEIMPRSGATWRMLLLDREDRLVGAGIPRNHPQVLRLFPPEVFEPFKALGIRVVSEWYDTTQALEAAHPGAAGRVAMTGASRGRTAVIGLSAAVGIFIVVVMIVFLATH